MKRSLDLAALLAALAGGAIGWSETTTRFVLPILAACVIGARVTRAATALCLLLIAITPIAVWVGWHDRAFVLGALLIGAASALAFRTVAREPRAEHDVIASLRASLTVAVVIAGASLLAFGVLFR